MGCWITVCSMPPIASLSSRYNTPFPKPCQNFSQNVHHVQLSSWQCRVVCWLSKISLVSRLGIYRITMPRASHRVFVEATYQPPPDYSWIAKFLNNNPSSNTPSSSKNPASALGPQSHRCLVPIPSRILRIDANTLDRSQSFL